MTRTTIIIDVDDLRIAGLASHLPAERRNGHLGTVTAGESAQGATASDERCRYGWRSTCAGCGLFDTCEPPRLQRFLERRSLLGMRRRGEL